MTATEQQTLSRREKQFDALAPAEQDRLRALQTQIDADPHGGDLMRILAHYHEWLKTLSPSQRARLADLAPKERIEQTKRIQAGQREAREQQHLTQLVTADDLQEVQQWMEELIWSHQEEFLAELPPPRRANIERMPYAQKQRALSNMVLARGPRGGGR